MTINRTIGIISSIIFCELAGIIGSFFTTPSIPNWYAGLIKPSLNPPSWVFAPVWTTLFALMGIALYLIWEARNEEPEVEKNVRIRKKALVAFGIQLTLNMGWSFIFFGLHNPRAAFIEIIFLWLAIFTTIILFKKLSRSAAWLLVPYLVWVSFASYLNYSIWMLN